MALELVYPHIEKPEGEPARLCRLPRVRISQIVMDYLAHGWSVEEMCRQHTYLNLAEAHAAMGYYFDHQEQIDQEIRQDEQQADLSQRHASRSPFFTRLRSKGLL